MKHISKTFIFIVLALLLTLVVVPVAAVNIADINFEIDGNTAAGDDTPAGDDWESVILDTNMDGVYDDGPATLIQDGNSGPKSPNDELNIFAKGGKFDDPPGWTIQPGNSPAQNDLTNVYVTAYAGADSGSGDSWIVMGMHRIKKQGTFDLDFEFNQEAWDGTSGTLVRTEGDIVVGYELSGNPTDPVDDLEVLILVYAPSEAPACPGYPGGYYGADFCVAFSGSAGVLGALGAGTMNAVAFDQPPWGAFDSDGSVLAAGEQVEAFFFAEAAINLSELGIDLACPGFGSVHAKSRSSLEVTADLKDLAGPVAFAVSCFIDGYKFHDLNADGDWDAGEPGLENWTIQLYNDDGDTDGVLDNNDTLEDSTTTDANGYYSFGGLSDGTYHVKEVCPENWFQSYPGTNPATACGDNTHTFDIDLSNPTGSGDFGNYQNATFSGMKYKDADNDGSYDGGTNDSGLDGWTIWVYEDDGDTADVLDANDTQGTSDVTSSGGGYSFTLTPGDYIVCEVGQSNWSQTEPSNSVCAADPDTLGLEDGGYAFTVTSGQTLSSNDFGNTPLSNFDVNFYDLTGSTNATIVCSAGSISTDDEAASPEKTLTANGVVIGTYTCTITITDP